MNNLFQNNYESDNDERLDRKFSYNYQVIKRMYPKASELPEEEVRKIIRKYYQAPKGQEEQVIKDYINQKEPEWQQLYGLDYEGKEENQNQDSNSFWQPLQNNDFWGGYGNKQNTSSSTIQPMTGQERQRAKTLASQIRPEIPNTYTDYLVQNTADMLYGAGRTLNGLTGGGLDYLGDRYGIDTRMSGYLAQKDKEGTGELARHLGNMAQIGGQGLSGAAFLKTVPMLGNGYVRWNGRRNLINQLKRGKDFEDINFGWVNLETLQRVNQLRELENLPKLTGNAYIPANVVKKFYNKRLKEGYTPEGLSAMGKRLFHEGGNTASESHYPHIQQVIRPRDTTDELGYLSQNPKTGQTVIKSMHRIDKNRIKGI